MAVNIYIEESFALPNGEINPAFAKQWDLYTKLAGQPKDMGDVLLFDGITKIKYLSLSDVLVLSVAADKNEVTGYGAVIELTELEYEEDVVDWAEGAYLLDEDGDQIRLLKWSEWKDEKHMKYGNKWYIPDHCFSKASGLKGSEMYALTQAGYTLLNDEDYRAIIAANTEAP